MWATLRFPPRNHIHNMKCVRSSVHYTKTVASRGWEDGESSRVSYKSVAETTNARSFPSTSSIELRSLIWDHSIPLSFRPISLPTKLSLIFIMLVVQQSRILRNLLWIACAFPVSWQRSRNSAFVTPSGFSGVLSKAVVCVFLYSQTRRYGMLLLQTTRGIAFSY